MQLLFAGTTPKNSLYPNENEDVFDIVMTAQNMRLCLLDGAAVSYDSGTFAKTLCGFFMQKGKLGKTDMRKIIDSYHKERFDFTKMNVFQKRGVLRGSFTTFLGAQFDQNSARLDLIAVGDTIAVLLDDDQFIASFAYTSDKQFDKTPLLLSTRKSDNDFFLDTANKKRYYQSWDLSGIKKPILLCMTDPLGEFSLRQKNFNPVWKELLSIRNMEDFELFVSDKRRNFGMIIDDSTLLSIKLWSEQ